MLKEESRESHLVRKIPINATLFALTKSDTIACETNYALVALDVRGAIEAKQHGMAVLQARVALERGIESFLANKGYFRMSDESPFQVLAKTLGDFNELYTEAWSLECENPETQDEAIEYARKCMAFVEAKLGLQDWFASRETTIQYIELLRDLRSVLSFLCINSRLERHTNYYAVRII